MGSFLTSLAVVVFAAAATTDILYRRIPNRLVLALVSLAVLRIAMLLAVEGVEALPAAVADVAFAAVFLALGLGAFSLRLVGGGDVKLLAAGALWLGLPHLMTYLSITAISGGALALAYLMASVIAGNRVLARGLPYGVAIAVGGAWAAVLDQALPGSL